MKGWSLGLALVATTFFALSCIDAGPIAPSANLSRWHERPMGTTENPGNGTGCNETYEVSPNQHGLRPRFSVGGRGRRPRLGGALADCAEPPEPSLQCTTSVSWGGQVSCTVTNATGTVDWSFAPSGSNPVSWVSGPSDVDQWSGQMIQSGTIYADVYTNDWYFLSAYITVSPRSWSWGGQVTAQQGSPGELDQCFSSTTHGLMSGLTCTLGNPGAMYTPHGVVGGSGLMENVVSGGPNDGYWYISSASARADLRSQLRREWRPDGLQTEIYSNTTVLNSCYAAFGNTNHRNAYEVNTTCTSGNDYGLFVPFAWGHETQHLNLAQSAATSPTNDVYKLWAPLVAMSPASLRSEADQAYFESHNRVYQAAIQSHSHTAFTFHVWRYVSNGFGWSWVLYPLSVWG